MVQRRGNRSYLLRIAGAALTYNPVRSAGISKDALERLKDEHPDIYDQYVTVSEWRRFHVKKAALQAA